MTEEEDRLNIGDREGESPAMKILGAKGRDSKSNNDVSFKKLVNVAVLVILVALIFITLFSFFFSMQEAIVALFHPRYQALMQAVFSLVVLVMGIYMIRIFLSK